MDHQKFSRTVELNVQGTIGVQKRVPLPQKRFFGTQFNWYISEFIETWNKVSFIIIIIIIIIIIVTFILLKRNSLAES